MESNIFTVEYNQLNKVLSPLFYQLLKQNIRDSMRLKDIANINPKRSKPHFDDDVLVPYIGLPETSELSNSITEIILRPFKEVGGRNIIYIGDILFARIEPSIFNKKYILVDDLQGYEYAFTSTEFYIIEILDNILRDFIFHSLFFSNIYSQFFGKTTGSTGRRRLDRNIFENISFSIPSKKVQEKIVEKLNYLRKKEAEINIQSSNIINKIDDYLLSELGIKLQRRINQFSEQTFEISYQEISQNGRLDPKRYSPKAKQLVSSLISTKYSTTRLSDLMTQSISGDWGIDEEKIEDFNFFQNCLVIRATEFDNKFNLKLDNSRLKYRFIEKINLSKLDIQAYDLLIEKSGGSEKQPVGRISIITPDLLENHTLAYSNFIHKIRVDSDKINPEYLFFYLKTVHNIGYTDVMQSQTNGIRNLIMKEYLSQEIPIPPIEKQKEIVIEISKSWKESQTLTAKAKQNLKDTKQIIEEIIFGE